MEEASKSQKKKILLIDDEEDFCFFVKLNLEKTGKFEVLTTTSGSKGIILASKEQPDLILLDIIMPEISGGQVAEQLLESPKTKDIPVLFITAIASRRKVQAQEGIIGGRQFLAKPVTPEEIMAKINGVFERGNMNYPAASCGVSKTARNEASFGEYDPERFKL